MNLLKNKMGMRVLTLALCAALGGSVLAVKAESMAGETVVQEAVHDESEEMAENVMETGEATEEPAAQPTEQPSEEPTAAPTDEPTAEPTTEPTVQPTDEPTAEPSTEPTTEPTQQPTTEPTAEPMPGGAYKITIVSPAKWQKDKATAKINIVDVNGTGWANIRIVVATENGWQTVADGDEQSASYAVELRENATIHVSITDHTGNVQAKSEAISCFDSTPPTVKAGVSGEVICIEATDSISGVAAVYVNGHKLKYNGTTLDANIREYADGKQKIAIYAIDLAGNVSQKVYVKNPFYGKDDSSSSGNDSKPFATKKPSSGSSGAKTTPKPTATPMPTDVPQATMQPQTTASPDIDALYALLAQLAGGTGTSEPTEGKAFSMGGNMKTVDLLYSKATNKQFITVQTRKGETYYIVIDYDKPLDENGEQYETYFLNLVDDRDLFGVVSKDEQPTPEPTATPTPKPTAEPKPEKEKTTDSTAMMALALLVVLIAGGAAAFVVLGKKKDAQPRYNTELDDDEEEIGEDNEEE